MSLENHDVEQKSLTENPFEKKSLDKPSIENQPAIKPIRTEVEPSPWINHENDCGVIVVHMVLNADGITTQEDVGLMGLRHELGKEGLEGTLPGNICRCLANRNYTVEYHTQIDWSKCTLDPDENFEHWDQRLRDLPAEIWNGFLDKKKLQESAEFVARHLDIINPKPITMPEIAEALSNSNRVIALVGKDHYVLVTGIDEKQVYFNNPAINQPGFKDSMGIDEFEAWIRGTKADETSVPFHEVILAKLISG
jgi:hypothetical protein